MNKLMQLSTVTHKYTTASIQLHFYEQSMTIQLPPSPITIRTWICSLPSCRSRHTDDSKASSPSLYTIYKAIYKRWDYDIICCI